jgi:hypothetical protein
LRRTAPHGNGIVVRDTLFGGRLVAVMHEIRLDEPALRRIEGRSGDFR